jgi:hypothetical protein
MANTIKLKRSTVPGKIPDPGDLVVGEVAVNTADGLLYVKHTDNTIKTIGNVRAYINAVTLDSVTLTGNIGNQAISIANSTVSTSTTTGALTVAGGVGVTGNIYAGSIYAGNLYFGNSSPFISASPDTRVIYVTKNGNDSNTGLFNTPKLTIKAALAAATAGTSVQVAPGVYTEANPITIPSNVSLIGNDLRTVTVLPATPSADLFYVRGGCYVWGITIKNYLANGFSYDPATPTQNVYVSPYIQNITSTTTTGTAVKIDGDLTSATSTKAMIVGFFTIINKGGKGIYITNLGYSQLVNIYTIACHVGILCESGGFCTLNGSDSSVGDYGLVATGHGPQDDTGFTHGSSTNGIFQIRGLAGVPKITWTMVINGDPNFYSVDTIQQIDGLTYQITIQEVYINVLADGTEVRFYQRSAITASAHTFEYVGAGTDLATALPQNGGIPIEANEVVYNSGGRATFTGTDHKGNFKIGSSLTINQTTGSITGDSFTRSMFAMMTPYILALEG